MIGTIKRAFDREPSPQPPSMLDPEQVQQWRLGELRGRTWFTFGDHEREVRADQRPIRDADPHVRLSDGEVYVATTVEMPDALGNPVRELAWIPTTRHPAGSFASGGRHPDTSGKPRRAKPRAAVDGLGILPALAAKPDQIVSFVPEREERVMTLSPGEELPTIPGTGKHPGSAWIPGKPVERGAERILSLLAKKSVRASLIPCRYGCHIVTETERGALVESARDLIDRTAPLLAPAIGCTRSPLEDVAANGHCHHPVHEADHKPVAVTIGPGGIYGSPLCAECLA